MGGGAKPLSRYAPGPAYQCAVFASSVLVKSTVHVFSYFIVRFVALLSRCHCLDSRENGAIVA